MSSPNPKLSKTIFSFPIRWVETKIFKFEDIGLEVERSQSVSPKISKWVFSHHFYSPPRTHIDLQNRIWMSRTHSMIVRKITRYRLEGRWRVTRVSGGETLKKSKLVFHHVFSRSQSFQNYLQFSNQMSRNQDIQIWGYRAGSWKVTVGWPENLKMGFFTISSSCLIELIATDGTKFRWV